MSLTWNDVTPNVSARSADHRFGVRICHLNEGWRWLAYDHSRLPIRADWELSGGKGFPSKEAAQAACEEAAHA